jgi:hypothetical protein
MSVLEEAGLRRFQHILDLLLFFLSHPLLALYSPTIHKTKKHVLHQNKSLSFVGVSVLLLAGLPRARAIHQNLEGHDGVQRDTNHETCHH